MEPEMRSDLEALIHTGDEYDRYMNAVVPPVFLNSLHAFSSVEDYYNVDLFADDSFVYCRDGNPTVHILERKICRLEHGSRALVFSSGMAAFSAVVMTVCKAGSHIICMRDVYVPAKRMIENVLVPRLQMTVTYVDGTDLQEIEAAVQDNTDLMIIESPATAIFKVVDLRAIAEIARRRGFKTYIDNSCATPIFQKPLDMGIDFVMHTMSKYMGGHSDIVGGVVVSKDEEIMRRMMTDVRELFGGCMGPMEAWLTIRGLRTLEVRMQRLSETGSRVAHWLEQQPQVKCVHHTSLASHPQAEIIKRQQTGHGGLLSFELKDTDPDAAVRLANSLKVFVHGCSWGGHESLVVLPLLKEDEKMVSLVNGNRGLIRIYCGLEGADMLIADLEQGLKQLDLQGRLF